jgi:hypothetical protein
MTVMAQRILKRPTWWVLLAAAVLAWLGMPAFALADGSASTSAPQGVLYEVTENMYLFDASGQPTGPANAVARVADAALSGWAALGTPLCPNEILWIVNATKCYINAKGADNVSLVPGPQQWKGTIAGTYAIVVQDNNLADAPEFVIETGSFSGTIDLSARPLGSAAGSFKPCGPNDTCTGMAFQGRFRLPFFVDSLGAAHHPQRWGEAFYLGDDGSTLIPVQTEERTLGYASVKLELSFP